MKFPTQSSRSGSVLVIAVIFCGLIGVILVAYLSMISGQNKFSHRSQVWNQCIPLCEAGIEEAMSHLNHSSTMDNFAINGWVLSGGAYRKERTLNGGQVRMAINTDYPPVITVQGYLLSPIQTNYLLRSVRVKTKINQRFPQAMLAKGIVDFSGSNPRVDSYNSTNFLESTFGQYDPLKFTDRATVATVSRDPGDFLLGNSTIFGRVGTGPGGDLNIGSGGNVGSTLWNINPLNDGKVQPGYYTDDVNVYIPDPQIPTGFGPAVIPGSGSVGGTNYTYVLANGDYHLNELKLSSSDTVLVTGQARIVVDGVTSLSGSAAIVIGTGASVEWYSRGQVDLAGNGVVNGSGQPKNFMLTGLGTCTAVSYSGSSRFVGTIYAPRADVKLSGNADACGALVGNTIKLVGNMNFHYDESLKGNPREGRFLAASWEEI